MIESMIIITNNPMSKERFQDKYKVEFIDGSTMDVLKKVRNYIHQGHNLLTHPLMSSIKPNKTPYRTVLVSEKANISIDLQSLDYIEQGIHVTEKFIKSLGIPNWNEKLLEDFQLIDYDLINQVLT